MSLPREWIPYMPDHHALLYISLDVNQTFASLLPFLAGQEYERLSYESLSISEVRQLISRAYQRPEAAPKRYFIVDVTRIGEEAQHALLKILEEPPLTTRFVFIVSPHTALLPTVRSRFFMVGDTNSETVTSDVFVAWMTSDMAARLSLIADTAKQSDETTWQALIAGVTNYLTSSHLPTATKAKIAKYLQYALMRGGSKKMAFEAIALSLSVAKETKR